MMCAGTPVTAYARPEMRVLITLGVIRDGKLFGSMIRSMGCPSAQYGIDSAASTCATTPFCAPVVSTSLSPRWILCDVSTTTRRRPRAQNTSTTRPGELMRHRTEESRNRWPGAPGGSARRESKPMTTSSGATRVPTAGTPLAPKCPVHATIPSGTQKRSSSSGHVVAVYVW